jgi:hypothetical protein
MVSMRRWSRREDLQILAESFAQAGFLPGQSELPQARCHFAEAAKLPLGVDHAIREESFDRIRGLEPGMVIGGEFFELSGIFAGDGMNAGFQGIETGNGFPFFGPRTG